MTETRCTCGAGHKTFGECLRAKGIHVGYCRSVINLDATTDKNLQKELHAYREAREQGIQPAGTTMPKIRKALDYSDRMGKAYDASAEAPPLGT